jgi:hypothetical protein
MPNGLTKAEFDAWPNCKVDKCGAKVCTWASNDYCYPHEKALVGEDEMMRRYDLTHERPHSTNNRYTRNNYMTRTYVELLRDGDV